MNAKNVRTPWQDLTHFYSVIKNLCLCQAACLVGKHYAKFCDENLQMILEFLEYKSV